MIIRIMSELHAILEIDLLFPYNKSSQVLIEFTNTWGFRLLSVGTIKSVARISMDWKKFKQIWGCNPRIGSYDAPDGTQDFMLGASVVAIEDI